jgi:hypothetical protein
MNSKEGRRHASQDIFSIKGQSVQYGLRRPYSCSRHRNRGSHFSTVLTQFSRCLAEEEFVQKDAVHRFREGFVVKEAVLFRPYSRNLSLDFVV